MENAIVSEKAGHAALAAYETFALTSEPLVLGLESQEGIPKPALCGDIRG